MSYYYIGNLSDLLGLPSVIKDVKMAAPITKKVSDESITD